MSKQLKALCVCVGLEWNGGRGECRRLDRFDDFNSRLLLQKNMWKTIKMNINLYKRIISLFL